MPARGGPSSFQCLFVDSPTCDSHTAALCLRVRGFPGRKQKKNYFPVGALRYSRPTPGALKTKREPLPQRDKRVCDRRPARTLGTLNKPKLKPEQFWLLKIHKGSREERQKPLGLHGDNLGRSRVSGSFSAGKPIEWNNRSGQCGSGGRSRRFLERKNGIKQLTTSSANLLLQPTSAERQMGHAATFGWHFEQMRWPLRQLKIGAERGISLQTGHSKPSTTLSAIALNLFSSVSSESDFSGVLVRFWSAGDIDATSALGTGIGSGSTSACSTFRSECKTVGGRPSDGDTAVLVFFFFSRGLSE